MNKLKNRQELLGRLERAQKIAEPLRRRLWVLAVITKALEPDKIKPILVGGCAVEFYTFGGYSTGDVDVVVSDRQRLGEILDQLGFAKEGRFWFRENLDTAIECPAEELAGSTEKVLQVDIEDMNCFVISIEDLIVDRLNSYVHWQWQDDRHWAKQMMAQHTDDIDWDYLQARCRTEGTAEALREIKQELIGHEKN